MIGRYILREAGKGCWAIWPTIIFSALPLFFGLLVAGVLSESGMARDWLNPAYQLAFFLDSNVLSDHEIAEDLKKEPLIHQIRIMDPAEVRRTFFSWVGSGRGLEQRLTSEFFPSIALLELTHSSTDAAIRGLTTALKERYPSLDVAIGLPELKQIRYAGYMIYGGAAMAVGWLLFIAFFVMSKRLLAVIRMRRDKISVLRCQGVTEGLIRLPFYAVAVFGMWIPLSFAFLAAFAVLTSTIVPLPVHVASLAMIGAIVAFSGLLLAGSVVHYGFRRC